VRGYLQQLAAERKVTPDDCYREVAKKIPLGRIPDSHEISSAVLSFASDLSSAVTGQMLDVNRGQVMDGCIHRRGAATTPRDETGDRLRKGCAPRRGALHADRDLPVCTVSTLGPTLRGRSEPRRLASAMALITVLSPVGELRAASTAVPPLPADLRRLTLGFLDNTKPNFHRLARDVGERAAARHGVARVVHLRKANAATGAAPEVIAALAKECDVVFTGSAD
jgi:hypothetical protein